MLDVFFGKLKAGIFKANAKDMKRMKDVAKSVIIDNYELNILKQATEYLDNTNVKDEEIRKLFISETYKFYKYGKLTIRIDLNVDMYTKIVKHITSL